MIVHVSTVRGRSHLQYTLPTCLFHSPVSLPSVCTLLLSHCKLPLFTPSPSLPLSSTPSPPHPLLHPFSPHSLLLPLSLPTVSTLSHPNYLLLPLPLLTLPLIILPLTTCSLARCNFALIVLSELVIEQRSEIDWAAHLPLLLHVALLGLDLFRPLVFEHSKALLGNLVIVLACKDDKMAALQAR